MARVVHFELHSDDPERAIRFYGEVFGWKASKWPGPEDYWLIETGPRDQPGIDGGLMRRRGPDVSTVNTLQVESVEAAMSAILAHGGQVVVPKQAIPTVGWQAFGKDPDGNIFGVFQPDPEAR